MRRHWPLAVVLVVQAGILAAMAAPHVVARARGTLVTLRTAPIDPYDFMSGYHLVLHYEVENPPREMVPPDLADGDRVWLVVRRAEPAWELADVTLTRPAARADHVALPARWTKRFLGAADGRAEIEGADRVYMPETRRRRAEELASDRGKRGLVDLRVGPDGTVAVLRLRIGGESFGD